MGRQPIDLTGQKFGKLTAIKLVEHGGGHKPCKWLCKCDCGKEKIVDSQLLRRNIITDCGCKIIDRLVGQRFGKLVVLENSGQRSKGKCRSIIWKCQCDCGNITYVATSNLMAKRSKTVSCGCHKIETATKHGILNKNKKIYKTLIAIRQRCLNPKNPAYKYYGERGIKVCDEWLGEKGVENFYNWAINNGYSEELTIDRIDNDGDYCPENCRWVSMRVQMNNTRMNRYITVDDETHTLTEWSRINNIPIKTIYSRIHRGWSDSDAVSKQTTG